MIVIVLRRDLRIGRGVKGDGTVHQRGKVLQLHFGPAQADIGFDPRDVPETAAFFHQVGEPALDQHINGDPLIIIIQREVIHPPDRDLTEVDQRAAAQRAKVGRLQVDHQLAVVDTVFWLSVEGDEVIFGFALARHHADIVPAHQRIEARHAGQRGFRRDQPELRIFAQRLFHIALDAGGNFNLAQVFTETNILDGTDFHPLIADRRPPRHDAVSRLEIDSDRRSAVVKAGPDEPGGNQQRDDRQQPEWRDTTFGFYSGFSLRSGRFLTHVRPKVSGCPAIQLQE